MAMHGIPAQWRSRGRRGRLDRFLLRATSGAVVPKSHIKLKAVEATGEDMSDFLTITPSVSWQTMELRVGVPGTSYELQGLYEEASEQTQEFPRQPVRWLTPLMIRSLRLDMTVWMTDNVDAYLYLSPSSSVGDTDMPTKPSVLQGKVGVRTTAGNASTQQIRVWDADGVLVGDESAAHSIVGTPTETQVNGDAESTEAMVTVRVMLERSGSTGTLKVYTLTGVHDSVPAVAANAWSTLRVALPDTLQQGRGVFCYVGAMVTENDTQAHFMAIRTFIGTTDI